MPEFSAITIVTRSVGKTKRWIISIVIFLWWCHCQWPWRRGFSMLKPAESTKIYPFPSNIIRLYFIFCSFRMELENVKVEMMELPKRRFAYHLRFTIMINSAWSPIIDIPKIIKWITHNNNIKAKNCKTPFRPPIAA